MNLGTPKVSSSLLVREREPWSPGLLVTQEGMSPLPRTSQPAAAAPTRGVKSATWLTSDPEGSAAQKPTAGSNTAPSNRSDQRKHPPMGAFFIY
jgi:hypothetical protein